MREKSSLFLCFFLYHHRESPSPSQGLFFPFLSFFCSIFQKKTAGSVGKSLSVSFTQKRKENRTQGGEKKQTKRISKTRLSFSLSLSFFSFLFFSCFPPIKNNPSRISTPSFSTRQTCTRSTAASGRRRRSPKARGRSFQSRRATCPSRPSSCTCASSCRPCGPGARGPRSRR